MTTAIFHALFFCHLQPIILAFVSLNMTLFFFVMKYMLFRRCKIPELTNVQVYQFAMFAISYGAVFYGVGSLFFLIIDEKVDLNQNISFCIPSVLCLLIWFLANLNVCNVSESINNLVLNLIESASKKDKCVKKKNVFRETINVERLE